MTAGLEAMREAARIEAAAFYGRAAGDTSVKRGARRKTDQLVVDDANHRAALRAVKEAGWRR